MREICTSGLRRGRERGGHWLCLISCLPLYSTSSHSCHRCHLRLESSVAAEPRWAIGRFYLSVAVSEAIREIAWESDRRFAGTREIEVRHRVKAAGESSFANARVRIEQKRLRFLYSGSREVVDETYPRGFLEHLAKVIAVLLITPCDAVRLTTFAGRTTTRF